MEPGAAHSLQCPHRLPPCPPSAPTRADPPAPPAPGPLAHCAALPLCDAPVHRSLARRRVLLFLTSAPAALFPTPAAVPALQWPLLWIPASTSTPLLSHPQTSQPVWSASTTALTSTQVLLPAPGHPSLGTTAGCCPVTVPPQSSHLSLACWPLYPVGLARNPLLAQGTGEQDPFWGSSL